MSECIRGYQVTTRAWYALKWDYVNFEMYFGMYALEGGTDGEMKMEWSTLSGENVAQLKCYEDAFLSLSKFPDLIQELGKVSGKNIQPDDFIKILDGCGFTDMTEYERK